MTPVRVPTLVLVVVVTVACGGLTACRRFFPPPGHGPASRLVFVSPADRTQVDGSGSLAVTMRAERPLDPATVTLASTAPGRAPIDLTPRLARDGRDLNVELTAADLTQGLDRLVATARFARHGHGWAPRVTSSVTVSWEPQVDVTTADHCDFIGANGSRCVLPFPNNWFTQADRSTDTGIRIHLQAAALPANTSGVPFDPTEWNRNDGWSPGSMIVTQVPGVDLAASGAPPITDIGRSLAPDSPIVIVDADTGERWPFFAELDANATSDANRALLIRPARNFLEGHRYVVGFRHLVDGAGRAIPASRAFTIYRDGIPTFIPVVESRRPQMERVLHTLTRAGVARGDLTLAWDFTVASARNLAGRMLHIRDDGFASLDGGAPQFTVTQIDDNVDANVLRRVVGTFTVPSYLTGTGAPGSRFHYASDAPGPNDLPTRNGSYTANFRCIIPRSASATGSDPVTPAYGLVNGHGLLGSALEVEGFHALADQGNSIICGTDEIGMASEDLGNVAAVLGDISRFPTLADRLQQGNLNMQFLARLLKDPRGFASSPAFQAGAAHTPLIRTGEVFFNGNSQGGILGGAYTAVSKEWTRAVLGVPAINYGTLLDRSVDYTQFAVVSTAAYPDPLDRQIGFSLTQMLWDRGEGDGYAQHMTDDPYPGTPAHQVLLIEAFGDHQVANLGTETEARTIGAKVWQPALAPGRSPDVVPFWGIEPVPSVPYRGSVLVMWDYGTPPPPLTNTPPEGPQYGEDPHGMGHDNPGVAAEALTFLRDGVFIDVCNGGPCQG